MRERRGPSRGPGSRVVRVDPITIVIFSVLGAPALADGLLLLWRGEQLQIAAALLAAYAAWIGWIASHRVELAPGRLVHRTVFTRSDIDLSRVVSAEIVSRPGPTLELREGPRKLAGSFIVKPFTRAGVTAILEHVRASRPGVTFDRAAEAMRKGDFAVVTRQTIQAMHLVRVLVVLVGALAAAAVLRLALR